MNNQCGSIFTPSNLLETAPWERGCAMEKPYSSCRIASAAMLLVSTFIATAAPQTVTFRNGLNEYMGTVDMRLRGGDEQTGDSVQSIAFDGGSGSLGDASYALGYFRFDSIFGEEAGRIPYGAHILSARFELTTHIANDAQSGGAFLLSVLNQPLIVPESGSVFSAYSNNSGFGGPDFPDGHTQRPLGAFRSTDDPPQRLDQGETASVDVTEALQFWALGSADEPRNHGFVVAPANGTDAWAVASSSNALESARPRLVITWLPAAEAVETGARTRSFRQGDFDPVSETIYEGVVSAWLRDNVTTPANTTLDGNQQTNPQYLDGPGTGSPDDQMLIQFNGLFGDEPGQIPLKPTLEIQRAVLRLTTNTSSSANAVSGGPADVHEMLVPWYEVDGTGMPSFLNFSDFKGSSAPDDTPGDGPTMGDGEVGPVLDSRFGLYHFASNGFDVTAAVRSWAAGGANFGLNVQLGTSDGWQIYFPGAGVQEARPELIITYNYAVDLDGDGLPDTWETANGTSLGADDAGADPDADSLTNLQEYKLGTHPGKADTDGDGLADNVEDGTGLWVSGQQTGTSPVLGDSDGDGVTDGLENPSLPFTGSSQPGTDPNKVDSDGDGFPDGTELAFAGNPVVPANVPMIEWETVMSETFDGSGTASIYHTTTSGGSFFPDLFDTAETGYSNVLQLTSSDTGGTNSNTAVAWDAVESRGDAVRLVFDFRMSADVGTAEAADGFGIGLFSTPQYPATDILNPGTVPRQWEDPRNGGGFADALMIGFDIYNGAAEGNNVRVTGPAAPGQASVNLQAPFQLNNGLFNRVVLTAFSAGSQTVLRMEVIEDVAGAAVPHVFFTGLLVPGWDPRVQDFRLITGGRTGGAVVATYLDNVELSRAGMAVEPPDDETGFAITGFQLSGTPASLTLSWNSVPGSTYQIEESADLTVWQNLGAPIPAVSATTQGTGTPSANARFWRVRRTQ